MEPKAHIFSEPIRMSRWRHRNTRPVYRPSCLIHVHVNMHAHARQPIKIAQNTVKCWCLAFFCRRFPTLALTVLNLIRTVMDCSLPLLSEVGNAVFNHSFRSRFYPHYNALGPWETHPQLPVVAACPTIKPCYSYAELAVPGIEPMTLQFMGDSSTNWAILRSQQTACLALILRGSIGVGTWRRRPRKDSCGDGSVDCCCGSSMPVYW